MSLLDCICCRRHGHRTAVVWDDLLAPSCLTYSVLVEKGCSVACYIRRSAWVSCGGTVGLYGNNCPDVLCALLGILAVPAAYVPVDLAQPAAMKEHMLRKLGIQCILVHYTFLEDFLAQGWSSCVMQLDTQLLLELGLVNAVLCWAGSSPAAQEMSISKFDQSNCCSGVAMCDSCKEMKIKNVAAAWGVPAVPPSLPAYTLRTSGTTGEPKTIRVPHCCIVPNIVDLRKKFRVFHDIVFNAAPLTFDPSVVEIFLAFSSGSTLLVVPEEVKRSPSKLATVLFHRQYVTVLQTTPSLVKRFQEKDIRRGLLGPASHLRVLAFGGESCPNFQVLSNWKHPKNNTTLFNIYGATEVSSWQTCYQITSEDLLSVEQCPDVPIGKPLLGTVVDLRDNETTVVDLRDNETTVVDLRDNETTMVDLRDNETTVVDLRDNETTIVDLRDNETTVVDLRDNETTMVDLRDNETTMVDLRDNETTVVDLRDNETTVVDLRDNETTMVDLRDNETTVVDLRDNETTMVDLRDNETTMVDPRDNETTVVDLRDNKTTIVDLRDNETTVVDLRDNETTMVDLRDNETTMVDPRDNETTVVDLRDNKTTIVDLRDNETTVVDLRDNETTMVDLRDNETTVVDLRDNETTMVDQQDIGGPTSSQEIWIGGQYRVCWLEGEAELVSGCMRPSGDVGYIDGSGQLYCVGRTDRQIKRSGHRINLDSIQQSISSMREVSSCVVTTLLPSELQDSPLKNHLSTSTYPLHGTDVHIVAFIVPHIETGLTRVLMADIGRVLPSYCVPDDVVLVRELPTTVHGKTDLKSLVQCDYPSIYLPQLSTTTTVTPQRLIACDITDMLLSVASELLGLSTWPDKSCILELGVDSFEVVRFSNQFETELRGRTGTGDDLKLPHLVEQLLTRSLSDVVSYISHQISPPSENILEAGGELTSPVAAARKRQRSEQECQVTVPSAKMSAICSPPTTDEMCHWSAWRRGQYLQDGHLQLPREAEGTPHSDLKCSLTIKWSVDTHKCVDASPLVVKRRDEPWVVYIGSHSGLFLAVEVSSGAVLWRTVLSDRVEGSAGVSACSQYIVVGCYDGCVYAMCADSGEVHSCYHISQDPIKSSPCVDPTTGLVWVGSHDHHIHAISLQDKAVVRQLFPGGGACFSSPCINSDAGTLHCATLEGNMTTVDLKTSMVRWVYRCPKPVFSSPALLPNGSVVVGCVDGKVYLIRKDGEMVGVAPTGQSIFSSCCVVRSAGQRVRVMSGSHDRCVYCWNGQLDLEWKTELDSEIYSTPCHCNIQTESTHYLSCICACSTAGFVYMLDAECGHILGSFKLPGNIFSSPVVVDSCIIVGCRDDHVYCIQIET